MAGVYLQQGLLVSHVHTAEDDLTSQGGGCAVPGTCPGLVFPGSTAAQHLLTQRLAELSEEEGD